MFQRVEVADQGEESESGDVARLRPNTDIFVLPLVLEIQENAVLPRIFILWWQWSESRRTRRWTWNCEYY